MVWKKTPVEDPKRIVDFTNAIAALEWDATKSETSFEVLFRRLSALAQAEIQYYYSRRRSSRIISKICRFLAWALGSIGILVPLVQPLLGGGAPKEFLSWGYVAFGAAGVVMIFDSVFAGTQAHQRYTATQLELEKIYTIFSLEWQDRRLKLNSEATSESALELVSRAIAFATELHRAMGAETSAWQETVNKGLVELNGKIGTGSGSPG